MNKTPSILVDTGFPVDQNGVLTEIVTPNVVKTLDPPNKVVFNGTTLNWIPSTTTALQEIEIINVTEFNKSNLLKGYTALTTVSAPRLTLISENINANVSYTGIFYSCTGLTTINMPSLTTINYNALNGANYDGTFRGCTSLTSLNLPRLSQITMISNNTSNSGVFHGCIGLTTINLPSLTRIETSTNSNNNGVFCGCTGLVSVQLGSEGHPVSLVGSYTFANCTQSGLTITIYTQSGAALSGSPWGATNATIVYEEA